ncbi:hypothetical protein A2U01_0098390, partial [Trifolium medium]|nr:hypothetical protein [Trifolium medium]
VIKKYRWNNVLEMMEANISVSVAVAAITVAATQIAAVAV